MAASPSSKAFNSDASVSISQKKATKSWKPVLVNKLELPGDKINKALFIPHEEAVISISTDKSVRVWIQRSNGQYWPSVCHYMPDVGTSLDYDKESGKVLFTPSDESSDFISV